MPLPDASKKSPRVYTNLQNLDLDNVTFDNIQATGNPIAVEEANEDELRRLVLVNLARLVTAGEWTGLLTAGGGGDFNAELPGTDLDASGTDYDRYPILGFSPWGKMNTLNNGLGEEKVQFFPFLSPKDGALTEIGVIVNNDTVSAQNTFIGVYSDSGDGVPLTLLGFATFDSTDQATQYDTSLSATITLERGVQYWIGRAQSTAENCELYAYHYANSPGTAPLDAVTSTSNSAGCVETIADATSLPSSVDPDDVQPAASNSYRPVISFKW